MHYFGETKVSNFDDRRDILGEKDVLRLQVSMCDPSIVNVLSDRSQKKYAVVLRLNEIGTYSHRIADLIRNMPCCMFSYG